MHFIQENRECEREQAYELRPIFGMLAWGVTQSGKVITPPWQEDE
jgi:hypothetical protein